MAELKFSGLVNTYINPSLVEEPIPGVKLYDGLNLNEFNIEPKDMKAFRKIIGFPAEPIRHKKLNRKSFKKALMAWGMPRNAAENVCNYIAKCPWWGCGYAYYAERHYNYIWR